MNNLTERDLAVSIADELGEDCSRLCLETEPVDYLGLFEALVNNTGLDGKKDINSASVGQLGLVEDPKNEGYCIDYHLRKFMTITPEETNYDTFEKSLVGFKEKLEYNYWRRIGTDRRKFSEEEAEIFICCSASAHERSLKRHLAEFFKNCRDRKLKLTCLVKYKLTINELIGEEFTPNNLLRHTQQIINVSQPHTHRNNNEHSVPSISDDFPFKDTVEQLLKDYHPRPAVLDNINNFIFDGTSTHGFLTIEGFPGFGKSTVLAKVIYDFKSQSQQVKCVWYFNSLMRGENTTFLFMKSMFEQLSGIYDLRIFENNYHEQILGREGLKSNLFERILGHISEHIEATNAPKLVIIIDALDEVAESDPTKQEKYGNILNLPSHLPKNIFFLISSRNFDGQIYNDDARHISFTPKEEHQKRDIWEYIKSKTNVPEIVEWAVNNNLGTKRFVKLLYKKCDCSFIYLFYVFNNIKDYNADSLPKGINAYYSKQLERILGSDKQPEQIIRKKGVLAGITCFGEISMKRLSDFCGLESWMVVSEIVQDWLRLKIVLESKKPNFLKFYHLSFYDFIQDEKSDELVCKQLRQIMDAPDYNKRLAENLFQSLKLEQDHVEYIGGLNDAETEETFNLILDQCEKARKGDYLANLLTSRAFCMHILNINKYKKRDLIIFMERTYDLFQYAGTKNTSGQTFVKHCIANLTHCENPIIEFELFRLTFNDRYEGFPEVFYELYPDD